MTQTPARTDHPTDRSPRPAVTGRVLVVGWSSFLHGEATAGDVASMATVTAALESAGVPHDTAWSDVMCTPGGLRYSDADPDRYRHVVFACGPLVGPSVVDLHRRFAASSRVAVGVSVIDPDDPAVIGFDRILGRDGPGRSPTIDLAAWAPTGAVPVAGVFLGNPQPEYGRRGRHAPITDVVTGWLGGSDAALLPLDTRLDPRDWRLGSTPTQVESVIARLEAVITTRLHVMVLALKQGVPALAVDPVAGGGKVTAQAAALGWPLVVPAEQLVPDAVGAAAGTDGTTGDTIAEGVLDRAWQWCLSSPARVAAREIAAELGRGDPAVTRDLLAALDG